MFDPDLLLTLGAAVLAVAMVLLAFMPPSVCVFSVLAPTSPRFPFRKFARWATAVFIPLNTVLSLAAPHRFPLVSDLIALGILILLIVTERKPRSVADNVQAGSAG